MNTIFDIFLFFGAYWWKAARHLGMYSILSRIRIKIMRLRSSPQYYTFNFSSATWYARQQRPYFQLYINDCLADYVNYSRLKVNYSRLKDNYSRLKVNYSRLKANYSRIKVNYSRLKVNYSRLKVSYSPLKVNNSRLKVNYSRLKDNYSRLKVNYSRLKANYSRLKVNLSRLLSARQFDVFTETMTSGHLGFNVFCTKLVFPHLLPIYQH
jgi:putative IMPACT (imprinted ancient) family translation regulator